MTLRTVFVIGTAGLLAAIAVIVLIVAGVMREPEVPKVPGNYVVAAGDLCALHVVRAPPTASIVLHPTRCTSEVESLGLAAGFIATTTECGRLTFSPSPLGNLVCTDCGLGIRPQPDCPLSRGDIRNLMPWQLVE